MRIEASSRVQLGSVPVSTKVLPASVVSSGTASATGCTPCALSCSMTSRLCCSAKKRRMEPATTGPTSGTDDSASSSASMMASILPKWRATSRAVVSPTWRMPSANNRRPSAGARALSIASTRLSADFWPMRSRPTSSSGRRLYRSASDFTRPLSTSWSTSFRPALRYPAPCGWRRATASACAARRRTGRRCNGRWSRPPAARWPSRRPDRRWA